MHWHHTISAIRAKKLELARLDPRAGMPVMPPGGAPPSAIDAMERRLGFPLPPSYRRFLELHDGWPQFFQGVSLFGAQKLARGTYVSVARMVLSEQTAPESGSSLELRAPPEVAVPFGIDAPAESIFVWDAASPSPSGELPITLWLNGVVETVDAFEAFLDLVLDMLAADVEDRKERAHGLLRTNLATSPGGAGNRGPRPGLDRRRAA